MSLVTPELIERFKDVGEQIHADHPLILARFYAIGIDWQWFVSEYNIRADVFYGYVVMDGIEKWCYFRNPENEGFGEFQIERDLKFTEVFFDSIKK